MKPKTKTTTKPPARQIAQPTPKQYPTWFNKNETIVGLTFDNALFTVVDTLGRLVSLCKTDKGYYWYNRDLDAKGKYYNDIDAVGLQKEYKLLLSITYGRYITQEPYI